MAHSIPFDTLKYANKLKDAGISDKQAEIQAELQKEILDNQQNKLATKDDIKIIYWILGAVISPFVISTFLLVLSLFLKR